MAGSPTAEAEIHQPACTKSESEPELDAETHPHGQLVFHLGDGRWWDAAGQTWRSGKGRPLKLAPLECLPVGTVIETTRVYLACAHLDHDPGNNDPKNLRALCQRCHILHDRSEHLRQRWFTYRHRKALGDLFLGPYPSRYTQSD